MKFKRNIFFSASIIFFLVTCISSQLSISNIFNVRTAHAQTPNFLDTFTAPNGSTLDGANWYALNTGPASIQNNSVSFIGYDNPPAFRTTRSWSEDADISATINASLVGSNQGFGMSKSGTNCGLEIAVNGYTNNGSTHSVNITWKDCLQTTAYFSGRKTFSNSNLIHTFKITKRGNTYNLLIDNVAIGEPITNTSYGLFKGIIRGRSSSGFDNFSINPQADGQTEACTVTTSPISKVLAIGETTHVTASVSSGLGSTTVTRMRFGSYNTATGTVTPTEDTDDPYTTTLASLAQGYTAVWATADLSDGRTCQSRGDTDTDIAVTYDFLDEFTAPNNTSLSAYNNGFWYQLNPQGNASIQNNSVSFIGDYIPPVFRTKNAIWSEDADISAAIDASRVGVYQGFGIVKSGANCGLEVLVKGYVNNGSTHNLNITWKDCTQSTAYFEGIKTFSNSSLLHTFKIAKRGNTYTLFIDNVAISDPITNTSYGTYKGIIRGANSSGFDNFSVDQQVARSCTVTTSPVSKTLSIPETTQITASVTSGLGNATVTRMRFGSYNTATGTISPIEDTNLPYITTFTSIAPGNTAVWATADLSDGRTCQSEYDTDTNVTVNNTYTSTFEPLYNGYNFENDSFMPTWELYRDTFGAEQVEDASGTRLPMAEEYYNNVYGYSFNLFKIEANGLGVGGNCGGMSATSLLLYKNPDLLSQFATGQLIPSYTHNLPAPQSYLSNNYPFSFWNSTDVSKYIAKYQGYWLGTEIHDHVSSQSGNIVDQYNLIKQELQNGFHNPLVLALYKDAQTAHALVPYRLEEANGVGKIYVYDSNDPCIPGNSCTPLASRGADPYNRYVQVNLTANPITWEYVMDPQANTVWENPTSYTVPLSFFQQQPTLNFNNTIASIGSADMLITVPEGNAIGYKNKKFINTFQEAKKLIIPINFIKNKLQIYKMPTSNVSIILQGKQTEKNTISIFGSNTLLQFTNLPLTTGSADTITADSKRRKMTYTTHDARKSYDVKFYNQITKEDTREFILGGLTNAEGEEDTMTLTDDNQSLSYTNGGEAENIHITIKHTGKYKGLLKFDQSVTLNAGESILLTPTNWDNIEKSGIRTQISVNGKKKSAYYVNLTTASISSTPNKEGIYNDTVTVSLSQQSSKSMGQTYFKIDTGDTQTYTDKFTISDSGKHTIEYWSIDTAGVEENHQIQTITIVNSSPSMDSKEPSAVKEGYPSPLQTTVSEPINSTTIPPSGEPGNENKYGLSDTKEPVTQIINDAIKFNSK